LAEWNVHYEGEIFLLSIAISCSMINVMCLVI